MVHSNDDTLTAEDMALGYSYKQQQRVEEAWRTTKSGLKMRPVFHWAPTCRCSGGTYFFTVNLNERRSDELVRHIADKDEHIRTSRQTERERDI
ncbi:MAG: hypothetical protein Q7S71_03665 [Candidatus Nitrotoga sp.]|nr:hypothetical protein [Candidatus Nitrotoga sp.]